MSWKGISDLTTTESNIRNFTRICHLIGEGGIDENHLVKLIRSDHTIRRTNIKVIKRHLSILKHLRFVAKDLGLCRLNSFGKMLCILTINEDPSESDISETERMLYFRAFLTGKTLPQLALVLHTLYNNEDLPRNEIIHRYYENFLKTRLVIWDRIDLRRRMNSYELKGNFRRPEINRFDCMRYWLEHLGLVFKSKLTEAGTKFVEFEPLGDLKSIIWSKYRDKITEHISYLFAFVQGCDVDEFTPAFRMHNELFNKYFKDAYSIFGNKTLKTLDWVYVHNWIPINLFFHDRLYILRNITKSLVADLYKNKVIESFIPGDYKDEGLIKVAEGRI